MDNQTPPFQVGYIVGSTSSQSINRKFVEALIQLAPDNITFSEIEIADLPMYNYDHDGEFPERGNRLKEEIREKDAILFATPEYNRSIPGVLKNALDFGSRPWGDSAWSNIPAAVVGAAGGSIGTAMGQQHLKQVLNYFDMPLMNQPEIYFQMREGVVSEEGRFTGEGTEEFLRTWMDAFAKHVAKHAAMKG